MILLFVLFAVALSEEYYYRQIDREYIEIYPINECLFEDKDNYIKITKVSENATTSQTVTQLTKSYYKNENCTNSVVERNITLDNTFDYYSQTLPQMEIYSVIKHNCDEESEKPHIIRYYPTSCTRGVDYYYKYSLIDGIIIQRENYNVDDFDCKRDFNIDDDMEECGCKTIEGNDFVEAFTCEVSSNNPYSCPTEFEEFDPITNECKCFENYKKVDDKCVIICPENMSPNESNKACQCNSGYVFIDNVCTPIKNEESETITYYLALIILILVCIIGICFFLYYSRKRRINQHIFNENNQNNSNVSTQSTQSTIGNNQNDEPYQSNPINTQNNSQIHKNTDGDGELKDDDMEDDDFEIELTNVIVRDD